MSNENIEHDEFLEIWTLTEKDALDFFGLSVATHEVSVIQDKPITDREIARYKPEAKLFRIKEKTKQTEADLLIPELREKIAKAEEHLLWMRNVSNIFTVLDFDDQTRYIDELETELTRREAVLNAAR